MKRALALLTKEEVPPVVSTEREQQLAAALRTLLESADSKDIRKIVKRVCHKALGLSATEGP